ncbi:MAG: NADH-quinone oxidoreductase subunit NuoH [Phycisphaerae bacterium]|nr:NADH-quinone oxidoreductase subunit NuoH [Phycisphaerae bacterium]
MIDPTVHRIESLLRNPVVFIGGATVLTVLLAAALVAAFPLYRDLLSDPFWFPIIVMAVILFLILNSTAVCILAERKIASFTQDRRGPNRVGFWGLLQPIADGMKFFFKEDIIPRYVDKPLFLLAPCVSLIVSLIGFAIIPWAGDVRWPWAPDVTVSTQVARLNVGILYILAVGALGVYGVVLAGYASNNKYSFYGGIRAAAQMISYELPLGLGLVCLLLTTGSLRLEEIVAQQAQGGVWYVFMHPLPFLLILVSSFAETNRAPFDLAEAEQELVGGFHTEYSSMKFAMFFLAEYAHIITGSAVMVALFFGGWAPLPFTGWLADSTAWWAMLIKLGAYLAKVALFIGVFMLVRWTIPRFRFDQLMRLAWQSLVPVGVGLVAALALLAALGLQRNLWACLLVNLLTLAVMLWSAARTRRPVTGRQDDLPDIDVRPA